MEMELKLGWGWGQDWDGDWGQEWNGDGTGMEMEMSLGWEWGWGRDWDGDQMGTGMSWDGDRVVLSCSLAPYPSDRSIRTNAGARPRGGDLPNTDSLTGTAARAKRGPWGRRDSSAWQVTSCPWSPGLAVSR